jgi:hypothetical protein
LFAALPQPGDEAPGVKRPDRDLLEEVIDKYRAARDARHDWREEAEIDFNYVAGHQWDAQDLHHLQDQERPALTWNRIGPFIDGVCGLEIGNRQEPRYIPRIAGATPQAMQQAGVNDLATHAAKWVRDNCDAEDEESGSFRDCVICGEGWTQTSMDYELDPDGMPVIEQINPMEMFPDPAAVKSNYADAAYILRVRDMPIEAARVLAPDAKDDELHAAWADETEDQADNPHNAREAPFYRNDQSGREWPAPRDRVRIVEIEWYEKVRAHRVVMPGPTGPRIVRMTPQDHSRLQAGAKAAGMPPIHSTPLSVRQYWRAVVGREVLLKVEGAENGGYSYKAITAKRDRIKCCYYGLVRAMRDPQMWSNKWLSQQLHIINTNAKGGVMVETDAIEDMRDFEDSWARADSVTEVMPGALGRGAIQPKPMSGLHAGIQQMAEFAMNAIPQVTGFSPEMMGMTDRTQAGVVEMQRKQQGMAILADLFNALRKYRKEQARLLLWYIQEFISDGRLIRIGGPEEAQYVPLIRERTLGEYDIVVDDTPSSPNMKERTWASIVQLLPVLGRLNLPPQALMEMLAFSPLPATLISKLKQIMSQMQQPQQQQAMQAQQAQLGEMQAKTQERAAIAHKTMVEAQLAPQRLQLETAERQARIDSLRAQAADSLHAAGLNQDDQRFQQMMQIVDALADARSGQMDMQQQRHDQAMDLIGAHHAAIDQAMQGQQMQQQAQQAQQQSQMAQQ